MQDFQRIDIENTSAHEIGEAIESLDEDLVFTLAERSVATIEGITEGMKYPPAKIKPVIKSFVERHVNDLDVPRGFTFIDAIHIYNQLTDKVLEAVEELIKNT